MILLFTRAGVASANIAAKLISAHGFMPAGESEWRRGDVRLIGMKEGGELDVPVDFETDCLLVLSRHRSRTPGKMLTAHVPGNWGAAGMGGKPRTLNIADAGRLKILLQELKREGDRIGWPVSLEADHHGPACGVPIMFVEIGNGEGEWKDEKAAEAVAAALSGFLARVQNREHETFETFFGVGGGHYPRTFTRIVLETPMAVGHILPKYAVDSLDGEMFRQAVGKNAGRVAGVLVARDETNASQRSRVSALAARFGIPVKLV